MKARQFFSFLTIADLFLVVCAIPGFAQESQPSAPAAALVDALSAACRGDASEFAKNLTSENSAALLALPPNERSAFLARFSLGDAPGHPLLSSSEQNYPVIRCTTSGGTVEFRFGPPRTHDPLSFIPVTVVNGREITFGLVRQNGGWRLLSLGLVLLDIPQLSKQWAEDAIASSEDAVIADLHSLSEAIQSYRRAYGKLPDSLVQLGPAPLHEISPDLASLVDKQLASGSDGGYQFRYRIVSAEQGSAAATFEIAAAPQEYGKTGRRSFLLDASGKIHAADKHGDLATDGDPLISPSSS